MPVELWTGKGAAVRISTGVPSEGLDYPTISSPFDVAITASVASDIKVNKVYLKVCEPMFSYVSCKWLAHTSAVVCTVNTYAKNAALCLALDPKYGGFGSISSESLAPPHLLSYPLPSDVC
eukprot:scaffold334738_cov29-Prasinocladus_malaysianus.AAC.1